MHKTELIKRMAERFPQLMFKDAENASNLIIDELIVALATGDRVSFQYFGSFESCEVPKRMRKNPRNGDPVEVSAKRVIKFRAGKELMERCSLSKYLEGRTRRGSSVIENVGADILEKYANHPDRNVCVAILRNPNCTRELANRLMPRLADVANGDELLARLRKAISISQLADSANRDDRLAAALLGELCPPKIMARLCLDSVEAIRVLAATSCPDEMLDVLAKDKSAKVKLALIQSGKLNDSTATLLAKYCPVETDGDASTENALGACPKCGAEVREAETYYECQNYTFCDFHCAKQILGRVIRLAEIQDLLCKGKTDLLSGFISNKTKRVFSAYLELGGSGKVSLQFPLRQ